MSLVPFSGRGKVSLAALSTINGVRVPGPLREVGNQSVVKLALNEDRYKRKDWTSTAGGDRFSKRKGLSGTVEVTLFEQDTDYENVKLLLGGEKYTQEAVARTEEVFTPTTLTVGDKFSLGGFNVGTAVIKDSAGTPTTLVEGTDYTLDASGGFITLIDVSGLTGPLKRTVTPAASSYVKMLSAAEMEYFLLFDGYNIFADGNPRVICQMFRLAPSLTQDFNLISEDDAEYPVTFDILADDTRDMAGPEGQYGIYKMF